MTRHLICIAGILILFASGCTTARSERRTPAELTADVAQQQVDWISKLLQRQRLPARFAVAVQTDDGTLDNAQLQTLFDAWHSVAEYLGLRLQLGALIHEWDSEQPPIQLVSNAVLLVDASVFNSPAGLRDQAAFDPNVFLQTFKSVSIQDGYTLDYYYWASEHGGFPMLYGRKIDAPPLPSSELLYFLTQTNVLAQTSYLPYLNILRSDGSSLGFFQIGLLHVLGEKFYRSDDFSSAVICTPQGLERFLSDSQHFVRHISDKNYYLPEDVQQQAKAIDLQPVVSFAGETATVKLTCFSNWRGFFSLTLTFDKSPPHKLVTEQSTVLVPYDCEIRF